MKALIAVAAMVGAVSPAATAQTSPSNLATRPGWEVGGQAADYRYVEPGLMKLSGERLGVVGAYTFTNDTRGLFSRIDARGSYGLLKYEGTGTKNGIPDLIAEARAVIGADFFPATGVSLSPYVGLGYRYLYNDLRGYGSTGAVGYRRYSNYLYAPVGLTARIDIGDGLIFAPTIETDVFLRGRQITKLSDTGLGYVNVTNRQDRGRGHRIYLMFERDRWALGAWTHYWHIMDSDIQPIGLGYAGLEPENATRESGLELRYRF
jgi:hypothetical protein